MKSGGIAGSAAAARWRAISVSPAMLGFLASIVAAGPVCAQDPRSEDFFENRVRPVLAAGCLRCHGEQKQSGSLRLDSLEGLIKGGDSGPAIDLGDLDRSRLLRAVRRLDDVPAMPPDKPLPGQQVADLSAWVTSARAGRNGQCKSLPRSTGRFGPFATLRRRPFVTTAGYSRQLIASSSRGSSQQDGSQRRGQTDGRCSGT